MDLKIKNGGDGCGYMGSRVGPWTSPDSPQTPTAEVCQAQRWATGSNSAQVEIGGASVKYQVPAAWTRPGLDTGGERTRNTKLLKMPLCKFAKISLSVDFARKGSLMTKALF